jgi:hypothetical protein
MPFKITHKTLLISTITLSCLTLTSLPLKAQLFNGEQNPLSVKWRQIEAGGFKIIYPRELEREGQRMANTLPFIYAKEGASLNTSTTQLPIVLQNRGVIANGFVQLGPKKSEFFTTPPQAFDSQDWLNNLAVHELRHVAQYDKLSGIQHKPFPELVYFAWMGASIPLWFFEGDAVTTETALTNAGRGRQPAWIMPYRANLLSGKKYSYSKAQFGSSKDVTPGYYQLGYLLSTNIRTQFGKAIFDSVLTDIKKHPLRIYPFSKSLKKYTGKNTETWYKETQTLIAEQWKKQDSLSNTKTYPSKTKTQTFLTDYLLPVTLENKNIIALKRSKATTPEFVIIDSNKNEKSILKIGYQEQPWFSINQDVIVWDEIRYNPRYRQESFSVICTYNISTKTYKQLRFKSRLFSPTLSPDGKKIIAVQVDLSNQFNLVELDANTGEILHKFENNDNLILQTPAYHPDGNTITYISVSEKGKSLWLEEKSGKKLELIKKNRQQISKPVFYKEGIAFNAHYSGLDNIYYLDINSREIMALSASKFGAFHMGPGKNDTEFVFSNYTPQGFEIATSSFNPQKVEADNFVFFGEAAKEQEQTWDVFANIPDSIYPSKPYNKLTQLFNFHSIIPTIDDSYTGGLQLQSDNLLNTVSFFTGVDYHRDLNRFAYNAGLSIKSFFPVFTINYENRPRRNFYNSNKVIKQGDWRENYIGINARVPISFSALNHNYNISANVGTSYTKRYMLENLPSSFNTTLNLPLNYGLTLQHSIRQAERDVAPRWGQILRLKYFHQPFDTRLGGDLFSTEAFLYFPGFARNHSFLANFNFQEASGVRQYNTEINTVYGYNNIQARSRLKNTLLFNYRFPIAFPDAELGPLAYIRNIRGGMFCHYENVGRETSLLQPKTYGLELHADMNVLRYQPNIDLGTRIVLVNKLYKHNPIFELLLNYSF